MAGTNIFRKSSLYVIKLFIAYTFAIFLSQTAMAAKKSKEMSVVVGNVSAESEPEESLEVDNSGYEHELKACQQELALLESSVPDKYQSFKTKYDRLMSDISGYASIRSGIRPQLQRSMDSLWQFRTYRLCAEINLTLLQGLSEDAAGDGK
ncbi:hypothetical protein [Trabulsiella guamensis]|nr:hypothetical protein [Trabulsiella guamensis]